MKKSVYFFPNLLTSCNMLCGLLSIIFAVQDALKLQSYYEGAGEAVTPPFGVSAWLIIIALVFDFLDGMVARLMNASSKFGAELDSLADMVSFGIAPAILLYLAVLRYQSQWGLILTVLFVVAGGLRLARFNAKAGMESNKFFTGVPIPAAASLLASYVLLSRWGGWWYGDKGVIFDKVLGWYEENVMFFNQIFVPVLVFVISCLMVSTLEFPSLKSVPKKKLPFYLLVLVIFVLLLAIKSPELVIFLLLLGYVSYGLITNAFKFQKRLKAKQSSQADKNIIAKN